MRHILAVRNYVSPTFSPAIVIVVLFFGLAQPKVDQANTFVWEDENVLRADVAVKYGIES